MAVQQGEDVYVSVIPISHSSGVIIKKTTTCRLSHAIEAVYYSISTNTNFMEDNPLFCKIIYTECNKEDYEIHPNYIQIKSRKDTINLVQGILNLFSKHNIEVPYLGKYKVTEDKNSVRDKLQKDILRLETFFMGNKDIIYEYYDATLGVTNLNIATSKGDLISSRLTFIPKYGFKLALSTLLYESICDILYNN